MDTRKLSMLRTWTVVAVATVFVFIAGCSSASKDDPELRQAMRTARYLTSPRALKNSMYLATRDKGTPSELLSFLFSDLGAAERPPLSDASDMEKEQARAIDVPVQPASVAIVAGRLDDRLKKQIVLKADDAAMTFTAEAYLGPGQPAQFAETWPMPELPRGK